MALSTAQITALAKITTPTVSNAIELFDVRPRHEGFMSPQIRCLFPDLGVMVGYAVTARFAAEQPAAQPVARSELWRKILQIPEPRVLVLQDLDQPPGVGAFVGEVMATIHQKLGCVGVVTNGHVRDLDEVRTLGFHMFAGGPCVSHAYVDLVDVGSPVKVGGLTVKTGDLLHGDKHGVLSIPEEVADRLPEAAAKIAVREQRIFDHCRSGAFSLETLKELLARDD
ncbi:MAG: RraA family protein [Verrucomicrobiota bacterium]